MKPISKFVTFFGISAVSQLMLVGLFNLGFLSEPVQRLQGQAIMLDEGQVVFAQFVTHFPPLPYFLTSAFSFVLGGNDAIGVIAATSVIYAGIFVYLFGRIGWFSLFVMLNPLLFRALIAGPEEMMLFGAVILASAGLSSACRRNEHDLVASDMINLALGFLGLFLSHTEGLTLIMALIPVVILCLPAELVIWSNTALYAMVLAPLVFVAAGFLYIGHVFGSPVFDLTFVQPHWPVPAFYILAPLMAGPVLFVSRSVSGFGRSGLALAFGTVIFAAIHLFISADFLRTGLMALGVSVGILSTNRILLSPVRPMLLAGFAGALILCAYDEFCLKVIRATILNEAKICVLCESGFAAGQFLGPVPGILVDAGAHPEFVAGHGSVEGLVDVGTEVKQKTGLLSDPDTDYVVVSAHSDAKSDSLSTLFPDLYLKGAAGYRLIYDIGGWRIYQKMTQYI